MYISRNLNSLLSKTRQFYSFSRPMSKSIDFSPEVRTALASNKPIVALESTIITHGMPHPHNHETAVSVESIVREQGAVPATIAIINGRIKVGLEPKELDILSKPTSGAVKTSRRDFPYVLSHKLNGGTTVSATLMIANHVGIKVFVTGGVGGVHRHGQSTLDISADLVEMGRHPIMVVSSGVKSILDIERTLEYLETHGVCVISYGPSKHFPAFYCEKSGFLAPYHVLGPSEAANVLFQSIQLGIGSGILLAVPVPKPFSIDKEIMDTSINLALEEAENVGIQGKDVTPFVLQRVSHITAGKSLESNIALIKNNARIGSQVAVEYQKIVDSQKRLFCTNSPNLKMVEGNNKVTVIGGSILDCVMTLHTDLKTDGRTLPGEICQTPGGVGRNIADSLGKLQSTAGATSLISAVGSDQFGDFLLKSLKHVNTTGIQTVAEGRTACYCALINANGDAEIGVGDMEIHSNISLRQLESQRKTLNDSSFIVFDGNIPEGSIDYILQLSEARNIPVWFEPTDVLKAPKPFKTELWKNITFSSPNMNELREMAASIGVNFKVDFALNDVPKLLQQLTFLSRPLIEHIPMIMITMGKLGILMVSKITAEEPALSKLMERSDGEIFARYYPTMPLPTVTNTLGAGDATAAGFIDGLIQGLTEPECVTLGHLASKEALRSARAVPDQFHFDGRGPAKASYSRIPFASVD